MVLSVDLNLKKQEPLVVQHVSLRQTTNLSHEQSHCGGIVKLVVCDAPTQICVGGMAQGRQYAI